MYKQQYFILDNSTISEEVGCWEQLDTPENYWEIENNFSVLNHLEFPESKVEMDGFKVKYRAILTDVLSAFKLDTSIGLFVNKKIYKMLENFNLANTKFYEASVINSTKSTQEYFFMHVIDQYSSILNIEKSIFVDFLEDDEIVKLDVNKPIMGSIESKKIVLKQYYDLFRLPGGVEILISENLKNKIEEGGLTGVEFTKSDIEFYVEEE